MSIKKKICNFSTAINAAVINTAAPTTTEKTTNPIKHKTKIFVLMLIDCRTHSR